MTEAAAAAIRLQNRIEIYAFSLTQVRDAESRIILERAIESTQAELDRLPVPMERAPYGL